MKFAEATTFPFVPSGPERDIVILMSGGVDSSVTAMLLLEQGYNLVGVTMKIPSFDSALQGSCSGLEAGYVCRELGIAHYYLDVETSFTENVIEPFRSSYLRGETPSPCVDCNSLIKFGAVWNAVKEKFKTDNLATGHYAKVLRDQRGTFLARSADHSRDQSYFLYGIPLENLPGLHLPLSDLRKDQVRSIAAASALPIAERADSMELCFAGQQDYRTIIAIEDTPGDIIDTQGKVIGRHSGIHNFTVGQRKGIGIAAKDPLFVLRMDSTTNTIVVGSKDMLHGHTVRARNVNVLIPELYAIRTKLFGKIRSQGEPAACELISAEESFLEVEFEQPQYARAIGQRIVLYDSEERVVAGAEITSA